MVSAAPPPIEPPLRDAAYRIVIDRIGVNANVFTYGLDANRVPEVPLNGERCCLVQFLRTGPAPAATPSSPAMSPGAAAPSSTISTKSQVGDRIILRGDNGVELAYTVSESFLVDPDDPNALSVMCPTEKDVITLITCGGSFYYTGDPVFNGDYTHRRIVRATFAGITPRPPPAARQPAAVDPPLLFCYALAMPDRVTHTYLQRVLG